MNVNQCDSYFSSHRRSSASLELDVLPYLGQSRIPDEIIRSLGMTVQAASRLYTFDLEVENANPSAITTEYSPGLAQMFPENCRFIDDFVQQAKGPIWGTTADVSRRPRERFIYWCFDILFLFCSPAISSKRKLLAFPYFIFSCLHVGSGVAVL